MQGIVLSDGHFKRPTLRLLRKQIWNKVSSDTHAHNPSERQREVRVGRGGDGDRDTGKIWQDSLQEATPIEWG